MGKSNNEKILTQHPEGKKGVNIDLAKYSKIKEAILLILDRQSTVTTTELLNALEDNLEGNFDGKVGWYMMAVKQDLEAKKIILHDRKSRQITAIK